MHMLSEKKWLERMENECRILFREGYEGEVNPDYKKLIIIIRANGFEPPSSGNTMPSKRTTHKVEINVTRDYPPDVPITRWLTPIFHPNIAPPGPPGYGRVCMEMLNIGISNLFELVRGLEVLLWHDQRNRWTKNSWIRFRHQYWAWSSNHPRIWRRM
ncbi:MAG: hypothetical protein AYK19_17545 [Theionarchaea archaeon DG-70-1]|nr:MAG: hypothetical protein AYK19_17545 [Theionarchaea archaeon DG-70-1]